MHAPGLAFLGLMGCLPELEDTSKNNGVSDANGPEIGETCTTVGVATVGSEEELDVVKLLEEYEAPFATRVALTLREGVYYVSGEVKSLDEEVSNFSCMSSEAGSCVVDLYNNCPNTQTAWIADLNTEPTGVACWYLGKEGEPDCTLDGTQLSINVED